jgi:MoaA/NifB/PqqE/SkfB family radical SAM enzyme
MFDRKLGMDIEVFCLPLFYEVNINSLCSLSCPCSQEAVTDVKDQRAYTCLSALKRGDGPGSYAMPMPGSKALLNYFYDFYRLGASCMKVARGPNGEEVKELFYKSLLLTRLLEAGVSREAFVHEGLKIVSSAQNYGKRYIVKRY